MRPKPESGQDRGGHVASRRGCGDAPDPDPDGERHDERDHEDHSPGPRSASATGRRGRRSQGGAGSDGSRVRWSGVDGRFSRDPGGVRRGQHGSQVVTYGRSRLRRDGTGHLPGRHSMTRIDFGWGGDMMKVRSPSSDPVVAGAPPGMASSEASW